MRILLILLCICLNACVVAPEPTTTAAPEQSAGMRDAIQAPIKKAEKVEDQVLEGAEKQADAIEAAGG